MKSQKRIRFAALDAALIVLILAVIASVCVQIAAGRDGIFPEDTKIEGEYLLTLRPSDIIESDFENDLKEGREVYLSSGEIMGKITSLSPDKTEVTVSGTKTDSGFLLNGTIYLAPNMTLEIRSYDKTVSVTVTDIAFIK